MTDKPAKTTRRRASSPRANAAAKPEGRHAEIAQRAYFIHLHEGRGDELENWLRAERELTNAEL